MNCTEPLAMAAGFENGSCTAAAEYVTFTISVKVLLPLAVVAGPVREVVVSACNAQV